MAQIRQAATKAITAQVAAAQVDFSGMCLDHQEATVLLHRRPLLPVHRAVLPAAVVQAAEADMHRFANSKFDKEKFTGRQVVM